jgi:hypothetical protein
VRGKVNLTCDAWQASNTDGYFAVTGHWIEESTPSQWELKSALLGFTRLNNAHNGKRLGQALYKIVRRVGIGHKVSVYATPFSCHWTPYRLDISHVTMRVIMGRCLKSFQYILNGPRKRNSTGGNAVSSDIYYWYFFAMCSSDLTAASPTSSISPLKPLLVPIASHLISTPKILMPTFQPLAMRLVWCELLLLRFVRCIDLMRELIGIFSVTLIRKEKRDVQEHPDWGSSCHTETTPSWYEGSVVFYIYHASSCKTQQEGRSWLFLHTSTNACLYSSTLMHLFTLWPLTRTILRRTESSLSSGWQRKNGSVSSYSLVY